MINNFLSETVLKRGSETAQAGAIWPPAAFPTATVRSYQGTWSPPGFTSGDYYPTWASGQRAEAKRFVSDLAFIKSPGSRFW